MGKSLRRFFSRSPLQISTAETQRKFPLRCSICYFSKRKRVIFLAWNRIEFPRRRSFEQLKNLFAHAFFHSMTKVYGCNALARKAAEIHGRSFVVLFWETVL